MPYRYGSNLDWDEVEKNAKERREDELRRQIESGPKPGPPLQPPPGIIDPRFPPQQVVVLPDVGRRAPGGGPPEEDSRSEAEKLLDPKAMLRRIERLEQIVDRIGETLNRFFGYESQDNTPAGRR